MTKLLSIFLNTGAVLLIAFATVSGSDWTEYRGPTRNGVSAEKNLPTHWSTAGENLAWKAPYGGRSAPIVMDGRLYLQNTAGKGELEQERLMCFNADTGKLLWEHRFNMYLSDVPPHRVGWASPVGDPSTGNVFVFGGGGTLLGLTREGKVLWERSLGEDFGLLTTHGGRTVSPIIEGDLLIVSAVTFQWGQHGRGAHRFMAFDKKTGETMWISAPGGRPYDTTYAPPVIASVNGMRLLIQGASDGVVHAIKAQTGEPVWKYEISKRGINTGVVVKDGVAILTHSEENLGSNEMGMMVAVDAGAKGDIKKEQIKWQTYGWQGGYSSPVLDGDRLYQIDNGANLGAFDVNTGKQLWLQKLGTIQKASPVFADGKLYVGTEDGKFYIIQPSATGAKILDEQQLGTAALPEIIIASAAVSDGRIFFVSDTNLYCIGKKNAGARTKPVPPKEEVNSNGTPSYVQVVPTELILKPGEKVNFRARLFDELGNFIREEPSATWSLDQLKGTVANGQFTVGSEAVAQAGLVKAAVGTISGSASVRVFPPLPWSEDFESYAVNSGPPYWTGTSAKYSVRELNGNKVFAKSTEGSSLVTRARAYFGPSNFDNYTVESDVYATQKRRQQGDAGVIAQRYVLTLYGNSQALHLEPWQPETIRTVKVPFTWKQDTWYHLKLMVENLPDGKTRARGKAWAVGEPEPSGWLVERIDPIPNRQGAPGVFGNGLSDVYFDNLKVYENK
ncbi:MAG TPA: PQQ-binding-like beta-propeller repeat protein [Pyrinomonadaceae bacterium]|nr:PQQ-binding-like beta-propeller repeat protein [Pyrinomonadaceae bacterium]